MRPVAAGLTHRHISITIVNNRLVLLTLPGAAVLLIVGGLLEGQLSSLGSCSCKRGITNLSHDEIYGAALVESISRVCICCGSLGSCIGCA